MPKTDRRTSRARILAGIAFSIVCPSMLMAQAIAWLATGAASSAGDGGLLKFTLTAPLFGLFLGWPFVLIGLVAWALLDQNDRHYAWAAGIVGLATGAAVALVTGYRDWLLPGPAAWPLCMAFGLLTGLGVWWIAYGRQDSLPARVR